MLRLIISILSKPFQEKLDYFTYRGENIPKEKIFDDFIEKGILQEHDHMISFKFKFWFNFFLAKKMQKDSNVTNKIIHRSDYLKFRTAIAYKAGLDRNELFLLTTIDKWTKDAFKKMFRKRNKYHIITLVYECCL